MNRNWYRRKYEILRQVFGYDQFRPGTGRSGGQPAGRTGRTGGDAHRRRKIDCYPPALFASGGGGGGLSADFADEGPGSVPAANGGAGGLYQQLSL